MELLGDDILPDSNPPARAARLRTLSLRKAVLFSCVCAAWLLPGLLARDPWKPQETRLIPVVNDFIQNGITLIPRLLDSHFLEIPPLLPWLGALAAKMLPFLPVHESARIASAALVVLGLLFAGLAAARKHGGHAGWMSVLLAIGCIGFAPRAHLFHNGVAEFAGAAAILCGAVVLSQNTLAGALILGFAAGFLFLSAGIMESLCAFAAVFAVIFFHPHWHGAREKIAGLSGTIMFALPWVLIWPLAVARQSPEALALWLAEESPFSGGIHFSQFADLLKTAAWAGFPALPIFAVGMSVGGRRFAREPLMALCLALCAAGAVLFFHDGGDESGLFFAFPALAVGAARVIQRIPENRAASLDWFALLVLGLGGVGGLWLVWLAFRMGFPQPVAEWAAAQTAGADAETAGVFAVGAAAVLTLAWAALLANFRRSNERAILNWSCGVAAAWCVFNLLWLPQVDAVKSHRGLAQEISAAVENNGGGCLHFRGMPTDAAAQLDYFGVLRGEEDCFFQLSPGKLNSGNDSSIGADNREKWEEIWRGSRPGAREESFAIWRRAEK